ncbi:sodium/hydrogen exchanger [Desulfarculus baarsii DSM 2075]|uniref:Sodium/hydrogen exchanger n=1 Tax=Desulfarculus baarsii (strain ATCC 33931 / DSM 2075 / LMG 7858 / VKM B-1802 / 2st14) TaxID=644282 RepID=E1QFW0_DESB2|nr:potassium/proton antiporter [Desulfarculus baarsii]ADK84570.1 sodium/hydrogen exchanger [Desulfarculus baarsii DSM 2075]
MDFTLALGVTGFLLLLSVFASKLSERVGVPALLLFLGLGMLAGVDGPGGIQFDDAQLTNAVGALALTFILFDGGFNTRWSSARPVLLTGTILSTLGVMLTCGFMAAFAHWAMGLPLETALLLGAIVSSTDAPAVFAILGGKSLGLKGRLKPLLEFESGSNDPTAVFLTLGVLEVLINPQPAAHWGVLLGKFVAQMVLGAALGLAMGWLATRALRKVRLDYEGLYPVFGVCVALICYSLTAYAHGNGFLAVYICGMVMGNGDYLYKRSLNKFLDALSWIMQIGMFLVLGLLVNPRDLGEVALTGLSASLFLMLAARPAAVLLAMLGSGYSLREQLFVAWTGLKGAAPIILATYPLMAGYDQGHFLFNLIFFLVLTSVLLQGKTLPLAARLLKVDRPFQPDPSYPLEFNRTFMGSDNTQDVAIEPGAAIIGRQVRELGLPKGVLILLIHRDGNFLVATGETALEAGDNLLLYGPKNDLRAAQAILLRACRSGQDGVCPED